MINQIKEKLVNSTTAQKYLALSVLPKSWTAYKIQNEFGVTRHLAETVKQLVTEQGILAVPPPRCGKILNARVEKSITDFYNSDEVSRAMPGKRDYVTVRFDGGKKQVTKVE